MKVGDRADFTEDIQASSGEQEGYVPASLSRSSKAKRGESQLLIRRRTVTTVARISPPTRCLQPLGDVYRVAEHRVIQPPWAAEGSCYHCPGVDSDSDLECRKAFLRRLLIESHLPTRHGGRAQQRSARVIGSRTGRAEDGHHRAAGKLV